MLGVGLSAHHKAQHLQICPATHSWRRTSPLRPSFSTRTPVQRYPDRTRRNPKKDSRWNITAKRVAEHHVRHHFVFDGACSGQCPMCSAARKFDETDNIFAGCGWKTLPTHQVFLFGDPARDFCVALSHVFFCVSSSLPHGPCINFDWCISHL